MNSCIPDQPNVSLLYRASKKKLNAHSFETAKPIALINHERPTDYMFPQSYKVHD